MNNKRILITGASGFIGSFLVEKALEKGYETWAGIRKSSSREYLQDTRIQFIDLPFQAKDKLTETYDTLCPNTGNLIILFTMPESQNV